MIQNSDFILKTINGSSYLPPPETAGFCFITKNLSWKMPLFSAFTASLRKKALCRMFFFMSFGTSGISATASYPLGGIVFLKQNASDFVEELSPDEQILSLTNRMITPSWTPALFEKNLFFAQKLASLTSLCRLHCTPTSHAVDVMKEYVDEGIRENK